MAALRPHSHHERGGSKRPLVWVVVLSELLSIVASTTTTSTSGHSKSQQDPFSPVAYWIWGSTPEQQKESNSWWVFRKTVELEPLSSSPLDSEASYFWNAKIAVDSKYWLWMSWSREAGDCEENDAVLSFDSDTLVVREGGLKRGPTPNDTWYDPLFHLAIPQKKQCRASSTIALPSMTNYSLSIYVLVWYWGTSAFSHLDSGQGGFLLDGEVVTASHNSQDADVVVAKIVTDASWSVQLHPAFLSHPKEPPPYNDSKTSQPNYRLPERNVYYDARQEYQIPIQTNWQPARTLGKPGSPPWNRLFPRTVPQWKNYDRIEYLHVEYSIEQEDDPSGSIPVPTLTIQGRLHNNTQFLPSIDFASPQTPAGIRVEMQTDNYILPGAVGENPPYLRATYITRPGSQTFESPGWLNGHLVTYRLFHPTPDSDANDRPTVRYRPTRYDAQLTGSFQTDDDFYNILWDKARRTLLVNMRDTFMDCPDRERAQWWGDLTVDIGQVAYSMDSSAQALVQKAIFDLVRWQDPPKANGCPKMFSPIPGNWRSELPSQMLAAVGWYGFHAYYRYTGDRVTLERTYPAVRSYLQNCWSLNGTTGLVNHRRGDWDWMDWGDNIDAPVMDNGWYALALRAAISMAKLSGFKEDVALWKTKLSIIETKFDPFFWTGAAYMSPEHHQANRPPDERGIALAVLAGLVPKSSTDRIPKLVQVLTEQMWASPYMEYFVLEALFVLKQPDAALQRMKTRYLEMVTAANITTLWENWDLKIGTYNHAWSGGPLTLLSQYVAGIAPTSSGWKTFQVMPQEGSNLTRVQAKVPVTREGKDEIIEVVVEKIELNGGQQCLYKILVSVPANSVATVGVPRLIHLKGKHCRLHKVTIDDVKVWEHCKKGVTKAGIKFGHAFNSITGDYVQWHVSTGAWNLVGSADCTDTGWAERAVAI